MPIRRGSLALLAVGLPLLAATKPPPDGIEYVPGRPWTATIPNPAKFDWSRSDRPGYHYRGMLPIHQRFYEYIQAKRATPGGLSAADQMVIRRLIALRRWPEAPRPNAFWTAFLQYLRNRPTTDLNIAQRTMLAQLFARGICPMDNPGDENTKKVADYLKSGPFEARNWFERTFGRVEPWIAYEMAANGLDSGTGGGGGNTFPGQPFNGLQITYNVSGASLGAPTDTPDFTTSRRFKGTLEAGGTLTVTAAVTTAGSRGTTVSVRAWAGSESKDAGETVENGPPNYTSSKSYTVSVPIKPGSKGGGFSISLAGHYGNGETRGLVVGAELAQSAADADRERQAADAKWRAEVEKTLRELGYEDTPAGRELKAMRAALHGGDDAWRQFVDAKQRELGYDDSPDGQSYHQLTDALASGGDAWNNLAQTNLGGQPLPAGAQAPTDLGGLQVGPAAASGQVQGAADRFDPLPAVSCALDYKELPDGSKIVAVWVRDGKEVIRSERAVGGGSGWVSFGLRADGGNLMPGAYTVTLTCGDKVLGRKVFTIGPASAQGSQADL